MARLCDALDEFTTVGGQHVIDAPQRWSQGRTLYGGMTAALCYEAAKRQCGVQSALRSAQFMFAGPASGTLSFRAEVLRSGRSSTTVAVDCASDAAFAARATFVFGADRNSQVDMSAAVRPDAPRVPEDCPPFIAATGGFHDNFELRLADGSALFSGGPASFMVWARFRDPQDVDAVTALLALADALPPAAMAAFPAPAPISTMSWTVDVAHIPASMDGWHLLASESDHTLNGYSMQAMSLRDATGRHLASGRQVVAIFI